MKCNLTMGQRWGYGAVGALLVALAFTVRESAAPRVAFVALGLVVALEGAAGY